MKKIVLALFMIASFSSPSLAVTVDKMFVVSDKSGNGSYVLTNDKKLNYFIDAKISEIIVDEHGEYTKKEYKRENIDEWVIALSNNKMILEPGRSKSLGVKAICGNRCDLSEDRTFEIAIVPKPYVSADEEYKQSMIVFIGYAPIFIIPAEFPELNYEIDYKKDDQIFVHNNSNTMIKVVADTCQAKKSPECQQVFTLIKGRAKTFDLPEKMQGKDLNITVVNHNESKTEKTIVKFKG